MASSLTNGLGPYDGFSAILDRIVIWGGPYLIGRLYFADLDGLRSLAVGFVVGGLAYIVPCWFEMWMSPVISQILYGVIPNWVANRRFGGWRPVVFLVNGLELGMWMSASSLLGIWMWATGALVRIRHYSFGPILIVLLVTNVFCKSTGAMALLLVGLVMLSFSAWTRSRLLVVLLMLIPVLYMDLRIVASGPEPRSSISRQARWGRIGANRSTSG